MAAMIGDGRFAWISSSALPASINDAGFLQALTDHSDTYTFLDELIDHLKENDINFIPVGENHPIDGIVCDSAFQKHEFQLKGLVAVEKKSKNKLLSLIQDISNEVNFFKNLILLNIIYIYIRKLIQ